jgi:hypothetical protein
MRQVEVKTSFVRLGADQQIRLLALLGHNITIMARTAYPGQTADDQAAKKLSWFNELMHTITGQLTHLIEVDSHRYADDQFLDALFERAKQGGCERELVEAFAWSFTAAPSPA